APGQPPARGDATAAWLDHQCRTFGADPGNAWALAHAVEAYGPSFKAADGRPAIDVMVGDYLEKRGDGWGFPESKGGVPVEPHRNHQTSTLVVAGVPLDRAFTVRAAGGDKVTLETLVRQLAPRASPADPELLRHDAWTVQALAHLASKPAGKAAPQGLDLPAVMDRAVAFVDAQQQFLDEARAQGAPSVPKRKQFIWSLPCGGFHHIQAAWAWDDAAFRKKHQKALDTLVRVMLYRLDAETRVYDEALAQAPQYRLQLLVQKLKFYGHWLETVAHFESDKLWPKSKETAAAKARARALLADTVEALKGERLPERMGELKTAMPQLYLDLIGDSCHALTG
ncbi:MAG: hypothetical protein ACK4N5_27360, partial [Myxococcales bacterium]